MLRATGGRLEEMFRSSDLLRSIPEHEREVLARSVLRRRYAANELIFRKNQDAAGVMFVASGRVKIVSVSPSGAEVILNIIEPGHVFGEMALLDGKPRSADAVAAVESEIATLPRRDFLHMLRRNPEAAASMMAILCERIRQATSFVEDAVLLDARARLLNRLKALANQYGAVEAGGAVRITHGLSQQEIGESVGLTRVSVNRLLAGWRERGLIEDGRGFVVIRDLPALEAAAGEDRG